MFDALSPDLQQALKSPNRTARLQAVLAVAAKPKTLLPASEALLTAANDSDREIRRRAILALQDRPTQQKSLLSAVLRLLESRYPEAQQEGFRITRYWMHERVKFRPLYRRLMHHSNPQIRLEGLLSYQETGIFDPPFVQEVRRLLRDPSRRVRLEAADRFVFLRPGEYGAYVPVFREALKSPLPAERSSGVTGLGRALQQADYAKAKPLPYSIPQMISWVLPLTHDSQENVRYASLSVLAKVSPPNYRGEVLAAIGQRLRDPNQTIRQQAAFLLSRSPENVAAYRDSVLAVLKPANPAYLEPLRLRSDQNLREYKKAEEEEEAQGIVLLSLASRFGNEAPVRETFHRYLSAMTAGTGDQLFPANLGMLAMYSENYPSLVPEIISAGKVRLKSDPSQLGTMLLVLLEAQRSNRDRFSQALSAFLALSPGIQKKAFERLSPYINDALISSDRDSWSAMAAEENSLHDAKEDVYVSWLRPFLVGDDSVKRTFALSQILLSPLKNGENFSIGLRLLDSPDPKTRVIAIALYTATFLTPQTQYYTYDDLPRSLRQDSAARKTALDKVIAARKQLSGAAYKDVPAITRTLEKIRLLSEDKGGSHKGGSRLVL